MRILPILLILGHLYEPAVFGQAPALVDDPSGTTTNRVPQGWKVETRQEGGAYLWNASESARPDAPGVLQLIVPDQPGAPEAFLWVLLEGTVDQLKIEYRHSPSPDEGHFLGEGQAQGQKVRLAAVVIRDPGQFLFIHLFSATPDDFLRLGQEDLLYRMLGKTSPFGQAVSDAPERTPYGSPAAPLNMQDDETKETLLRQSAPITPERLHGEWLQAFGLSTGQAYRHLISGEEVGGSRGEAHLLELKPDGRYALSYLYHLSEACLHRAEISESGRWSLSGQELTLRPEQYNGTLTVCGKATREQKSRPPARTFRIGMDAGYRHLTLQGKPFEYTVGTRADAQGQAFFLEGFTRQ